MTGSSERIPIVAWCKRCETLTNTEELGMDMLCLPCREFLDSFYPKKLKHDPRQGTLF